MDVRDINPATLPRMDAAHFSPPCTSTTRLRRQDLCGHKPRGPDNETWGDEDDEASAAFNEYLDLIIRIIKEPRRVKSGVWVAAGEWLPRASA